MITGIDYIFYTDLNFSSFIHLFESRIIELYPNFYRELDNDDNVFNIFYTQDKNMFEAMDKKGFFLDRNKKGPIYIIFNPHFSSQQKRVSLVVPCDINKSSFCYKVYNMIKEIVTNTPQKQEVSP